jgi:deoxycytidine triphosphate deaminase
MRLLSGEDLGAYVRNMTYATKQIHDDCVHLTGAQFHRLQSQGKVDFGGSEYKEAESEPVPLRKLAADDQLGWWTLGPGTYLLDYNETLRLPPNCFALLTSLERILLNGCFHPVVVAPGGGEIIRVTFSVGSKGIEIKQNARISKLIAYQME